jgi:hypothetical protein
VVKSQEIGPFLPSESSFDLGRSQLGILLYPVHAMTRKSLSNHPLKRIQKSIRGKKNLGISMSQADPLIERAPSVNAAAKKASAAITLGHIASATIGPGRLRSPSATA